MFFVALIVSGKQEAFLRPRSILWVVPKSEKNIRKKTWKIEGPVRDMIGCVVESRDGLLPYRVLTKPRILILVTRFHSSSVQWGVWALWYTKFSTFWAKVNIVLHDVNGDSKHAADATAALCYSWCTAAQPLEVNIIIWTWAVYHKRHRPSQLNKGGQPFSMK